MPKFRVGEIQPNPFRHIDRYPIRLEKVTALRESYRTTGFWGNVVARKQAGRIEIAYGHHRLAAAREEFGPRGEIELIIRSLNDEQMLQIMARENMEEWGTSAAIEQETVRAVVEAYAENKIRLEAPAANRGIRNAPGFIPGAREEYPYNAMTIARFLGWLQPNGDPQDKVGNALAALQFIEEGLLSEDEFEGLSTKQAEAVVEETRRTRDARESAARAHAEAAERAAREAEDARARQLEAERIRLDREAEAKQAATAAKREKAEREARQASERERQAREDAETAKRRQRSASDREKTQRKQAREETTRVGKRVSTRLRGGAGVREAYSIANEVRHEKAKSLPDFETFARSLATDLAKVLGDQDPRVVRIKETIKYADHLRPASRESVARSLDGIAKRASGYATRLRESDQPARQQDLALTTGR